MSWIDFLTVATNFRFLFDLLTGRLLFPWVWERLPDSPFSNLCVFFADNRVLIVIGGDDNYKNKDEEDRQFISRWAKRKISSQFAEEFLDGRKSFIFSWYWRHRVIHEEALLHFFDPEKKGQKFEYHPQQRQAVIKPIPPSQREVAPSTTSRPYHSVPEKQSFTKKTDFSFYGLRHQSYKTGGISGAGHQRADGSTMVPNPLNSPQETLSSMRETQISSSEKGPEFSNREIGRRGIESQGARPRGTTSLTKQPQETNGG